jgi:peptidyl-tRNA hydrolase
MKIIFAQGNPGNQYNKTRHNVGFFALDLLAKKEGLEWKAKADFKADITDFIRGDEHVILIKPQTFYNLTGESLKTVMHFYKIDIQDVLVICDDLNIPFGMVRARQDGSDGGNNGLKSLIQYIGSNFARVRIGTGNDLRQKMDDSEFVLSRFNSDEIKKIPVIFDQVSDLISSFIDGTFQPKTQS